MDTELSEAILHGDILIAADDSQPVYSDYKFNAKLRTAVAQALGDARAANSAVQLAAGNQAAARGLVITSRERLAGLVRNAHNAVFAVPVDTDEEEQERLEAAVSLGFVGGQTGNLADRAHLFSLVDSILANDAALPVAYRVSAAIISRLTNWRGVHAGNEIIAAGGSRETLTEAKDRAKAVLLARISRVRLYVASCSDDGEYSTMLARYFFQVRRKPGDAQPQPKPEAIAGVPTFSAATRMLSIAALPAHASRLVAWRRIAGGEWEACGTSAGTSVDAAETSPFIPGGVYELAVSGRNSVGDGPRSASVSWTAPL